MAGTNWASSRAGITANFVGPDDLFNRGPPNTVVGGKRRPVFFIRRVFEKLVEAEPECSEAPEQTRPAEPALLKPTAGPTPDSPQSKRAWRYIKKLSATARTNQPRQSTEDSPRIKTYKPNLRRRMARGACLLRP